MIFNGLLSRFTPDIGIDLGIANTLLYVRREGIVLRESSVVAKRVDRGGVLAVCKRRRAGTNEVSNLQDLTSCRGNDAQRESPLLSE
jgi:hypothetical protein